MFFDKIKTDGKTLVSCRDGIQEYLGVEIGRGEPDKVYKVYRDAETIKTINLIGVPITNDHVDGDKPYTTLGSVRTNDVIDAVDEGIKKTIEIRNTVTVCRDLQNVINSGKNELSLGYDAKISEADGDNLGYDFKQTDIVPHHLAVVDKGRCGDSCKFKDGEVCTCGKCNDNKSKDDKNMDIKDYSSASEALTTILSLMPTFDVDDMETMKKKMAKAGEKKETDEERKEREKKEADMEAEKKKETDEEAEKKVKDQVNEYIGVISRAKGLAILDETFDFADKTALEIQKACIGKIYKEDAFSDSEIPTVFKTLKKSADPHKDFGNGGGGSIFKDKEIE